MSAGGHLLQREANIWLHQFQDSNRDPLSPQERILTPILGTSVFLQTRPLVARCRDQTTSLGCFNSDSADRRKWIFHKIGIPSKKGLNDPSLEWSAIFLNQFVLFCWFPRYGSAVSPGIRASNHVSRGPQLFNSVEYQTLPSPGRGWGKSSTPEGKGE